MKQATTVTSALLLLAVLMASQVLTTFAATSVTISTDKSSYLLGQTLTISGTVSPVALGQDVAIMVYDPASDLKYLDQITPSATGTYSANLMTFRSSDPAGKWTVKATYQGVQAVTTFTYLRTSSISCSVSPSSLTIGGSVTVSGSITPARSGVAITVSSKSDESWNTLATVTSASNGSYSYSWKPASAGSYQLKASWAGDDTYNGATSSAVSVAVTKISTTISCSVSSSEVTEGDSVTVSGSVSPAVSGKSVTLTYKKPDASTFTRKVTTGSDGGYSDSYKPDAVGSWSASASWDGDPEHQNASSRSASFNVKKKGCIIATATYGSELSPQVQFLRGFRDNMVLKTFAGSSFMAVFDAWYYSFSPTVASTISGNEILRGGMKVVLYPLIGVLHLSSGAFSLLSFNPELGVIMAGLVASSLIGIIYFLPLVLLVSFFKRFKPSERTIRLAALVWGGSALTMVLAGAATSSTMMMASTGTFVLATICLTTLAMVRSAMKGAHLLKTRQRRKQLIGFSHILERGG
jgi:peptide/nickel transport system substrate-binding protein